MSSTRRPGPSTRTRVREHGPGRMLEREDRLATEEPLEIRCAWPGTAAHRVSVTMRTPGHDFELAAGYLYGEGTLGGPDALHTVAYCTDQSLPPDQEHNVVTVTLRSVPARRPTPRGDGGSAATSACGVCGAQSIDDVLELTEVRQRPPEHPPVPADVLHALPDRLRAAQRVFDSTGGLHAAGLFTAAGEPLVVREDIGRHNAVDKVVGARLLAGETTSVPVLVVSGRIGFEIVQKAVAARIGLLAAVGAPSSLAVDLAGRAGLGLVGFLRDDRFVSYAAGDRIGV